MNVQRVARRRGTGRIEGKRFYGHPRGIDEDTFGWAQQNNQQQMRGLDEEVQQIKSDVLGIAAELNQLEEKLLYPSGTQVAIFVSLAKGDQMRLDVRLQIDGQLVAHRIYNFKELEALRKGGALHKKSWAVIDRPYSLGCTTVGALYERPRCIFCAKPKGGVQRIYVGNVSTGDHKLEVLVDGKLEGGADFSRTERFTIHKEVKPKLVGLTLAGSGNTPIPIGEW